MALSETARGVLEKHIDNIIRDIPEMMSITRMKEVKDRFLFKSEEDFLYGLVYGRIIYGLDHLFLTLFGRRVNKDEMLEINVILGKRMREVRDAITSTG
jgi:hypothetical protein